MSILVQNLIYAAGPRDAKLRGLLLALGHHADDNGLAWPGLATLAVKCCCDVRTVQRRLDTLEQAGWLSVQRRALAVQTERGWEKRGNIYQLDLHRLRGDTQGRGEGEVDGRSRSWAKARREDEDSNQVHRSRPVDFGRRDDKTGSARRQNAQPEMTKQVVRDDKIAAPLLNSRNSHRNHHAEVDPPVAPLAGCAVVDSSAAGPRTFVEVYLGVGEARTTARAKATATTPVLRAPGVSMERGGGTGASSGARRMREDERERLDGHEAALWDESSAVLARCGVVLDGATRRLQRTLMRALEMGSETLRVSLADAGGLAERRWREYRVLVPGERQLGMRRFFAELWLQPEAWPVPREVREREQQRMRAAVGTWSPGDREAARRVLERFAN